MFLLILNLPSHKLLNCFLTRNTNIAINIYRMNYSPNILTQSTTSLCKLTKHVAFITSFVNGFRGANWLGKTLTGPLPCDMNLTVKDAMPIISQFSEYIPHEFHHEICRISIQPHSADKLIFTPSTGGTFLAKLYADYIRTNGTASSWENSPGRVFSNLIFKRLFGKLFVTEYR